MPTISKRASALPSSRTLSPLVLVLSGVIVSSLPANAQSSKASAAPATDATATELAAIRQQMAELQKRLDALETSQRAKTTPAPTPTTTPTSTVTATPAPIVTTASKIPVRIGGLIQAQALGYANEDIRNNGNRSNNTFRLRRGEFQIVAPTITPRISGLVMFDVAKFTSGSGNNTNIRARDNILQDLQISLRLNPKSKNAHFIDMGQFKIPIGYESAIVGSAALPFTERSLIFTQRDPFDGGYGDVRDAGLQLRGTVGRFEYRTGIFNGFGDRQNALALSDEKALMAWLAYHPVPELIVGVSGATGKTGVQTVVNNATVTTRDNRHLFNLFLHYQKRKFSLQGEYLKGSSAPLVVSSGSVAGRDIWGYYLGGGYYVAPKWELVARYEYLNTNRNLSDADVSDIIAGLNYYLNGNNAKLQFNLVRFRGNDNAPTNTNPITNLRNDRIELRSGVQVAF